MSFFFNSDGKLCDPMGVVLVSEGNLKPEDTWINVKTQFAGPEIYHERLSPEELASNDRSFAAAQIQLS